MKIAITGTIASGKTEVCKYLENKGLHVFYADEYNNYLLHNNNYVKDKIKELFPQTLIDGEIDNQKLAELVFNDKNSLNKLEEILYPLILNKITEEESKHVLLICEIPLLFEKSWDKYFDHNLLIVAEDKDIKTRLINKGYTNDMINRRLSNQMSVSEKVNRAEEIIYNRGSFPTLYSSIDNWISKYVR